MRRFLFVCAVAVLLCVSARAFADAQLAPHRAIYRMSLASVKNGSPIGDVSGKMLFDWADACDGWAIQQRLMLHFSYAEGDDSDLTSSVVTWESKDGKKYNFNVRRASDGKETETFRGRATLDDKGGVGRYTMPKDKKAVELPVGALFPSAHTAAIIEKAKAGEKMFTKRVFDGSDEDGAADISAFIGDKIGAYEPKDPNAKLAKDNALLQAHAWPVRLAFYKPQTETGEPDYEMDLVLQENGVARSMHMDYGDFTVTGELESLEAAASSGCAGKN
jgi:hypothetical protein